MMVHGLNVGAQALGLLSVLLLAVPAFYAARYGKLLTNLYAAAGSRQHAPEAFDEAARALTERRDSWTPRKAWCLRLGTMLAALSYLVALIAAVLAP
jgi:nicotinamide riboside transporter PnuC